MKQKKNKKENALIEEDDGGNNTHFSNIKNKRKANFNSDSLENNSVKKKKKKTVQNNEDEMVSLNKTDFDGISQNDNIDNENDKKRKKKKMQTTDHVDESKMSKRQLKREKHAQRMAEAEAASHKTVQMQALSYLSLWKYNRAEWKFNKVKQIWLYKNKFENDKIPDELWEQLIEYFSGATGSIKQLLIDDCEKIISEMEQSTEENDKAKQSARPSQIIYQRARDLLQNIHN